ncbi:hypothetical protein CEF21_12490 [Bacillus sp. FJAT-42376]|uniref:hypothetical protein n=1 Tax=Bacillus sp. FJAT-42376 TaxID=2014076 RepID=UPI000F4FF432|nr:hypothetical protein [Bacillus sp. FJAT-42376]AZB43056.1 hypothetical protein CEF21_12490 [Bacillus sp. FJAT-42376]
MGVCIKSVVINEVSGGVVHFGNAVNVGTISSSKSAEGSGSGSEAGTTQPGAMMSSGMPGTQNMMNSAVDTQRANRTN